MKMPEQTIEQDRSSRPISRVLGTLDLDGTIVPDKTSTLVPAPPARKHVIRTVATRLATARVKSNVGSNPLVEAESTVTIESYLKSLESQDIQLLTIEKYRQCLKTFSRWLKDREISEQSAREFLGYLREQNFARSTIHSYYHALRPLLFSLGVNLKIKYRRHQKLPRYHTVDQVKAVLSEVGKRSDNWSQLGDRDWLIIAMLAYTGIRRGELLEIKRSDVDLVNMMLTIHGKGDNQRTVPLFQELRIPLTKYLEGFHLQDKIFPIKSRRCWTIVTNYAHAAGISDLHPHSFRHFFATQLVERGVPINNIKELLGHADIGSTAIYLDALPSHLRSAISALPDLGK